MSLVYAPNGLIGVLTPQANTTVEPELQLLCPPGVALLSARMSSQAPELRQRLLDYYEQLPNWISQFANAPLGAVASACTGSSYLIGAQAEDLLFGRLTYQIGKPNLVLLWHALELMQGHADAPRAQRLSDMLQDARWRESLQALG